MNHGISRIRRAGVGVLAALTASAGLIPFAPQVGAASNLTSTRFGGADRFDTAKLVGAAFGASSTVVIARGDLFPDALAGAYLAGHNAAQLLLTRSDSIPSHTADALTASGATRAFILGGTTAINTSVETALRGRGLTVERVGGATRYDTAQLIAEKAGAAGVASFNTRKTAIVALGSNFPDALSGGPVSYSAKFPILLTTGSELSSQARTGLTNLGVTHVLLLGGEAVVAPAVQTAIAAMPGMTVQRVFGGNRMATSVAVANLAQTSFGFTKARVGVARGDAFPDALTYGPLAGKARATVGTDGAAGTAAPNNVLLTEAFNLVGQPTLDAVTALQPTLTQIEFLGGLSALTAEVASALVTAGQGSTTAANVAMTSNNVAAGGSAPGSITGSDIGDVFVSGCGFSDTLVRNGAGSFTLGPFTSTAGACTLTFTLNRTGGASALTQTVSMTVGTTTASAVTLTNSSAPVGGVVNGTVTSPSSVSSLLVSGCNLTNQNVTIDSSGGFSFNLPGSQGAGSCSLTFTINRNTGAVESAGPLAFTVTTSTVSGATNGPDLVSASARADLDQVTYTFDQAPTGTAIAAPPIGFRIYSGTGTFTLGTGTSVVNGNAVTVQFPSGTVATATLATVDGANPNGGGVGVASPASVTAAGGQGNPTASVPVASGSTPNTTLGPDLRNVQNVRTEAGGNVIADFVFDQVVAPGTISTAPTGVVVGGFELILTDNSRFPGAAIATGVTAPGGAMITSSDGKTVTVNFGSGLNISQVVRGAIDRSAVTSQSAPATLNPDGSAVVAFGGATSSADLVSAQVVGTDKINATFDMAVGAGASNLSFVATNANGAFANPTVAGTVRSSIDQKIYELTFLPGFIGGAVSISVNGPSTGGNVISTGAPGLFTTAEDATVALASVQAGRTALPDLTGVRIEKDGLGNPIVTYTFDSGLPGAYTAPNTDFLLYDINGQASIPSAVAGNFSDDRTQIKFGGTATTPASGTFTLATANAALVGSVRDVNSGGALPPFANPPFFPEGGVVATKTGF